MVSKDSFKQNYKFIDLHVPMPWCFILTENIVLYNFKAISYCLFVSFIAFNMLRVHILYVYIITYKSSGTSIL